MGPWNLNLMPFPICKLLSYVAFGWFVLLGTRKVPGVSETHPHCGWLLGPSAKLALGPNQFYWLGCEFEQTVKLGYKKSEFCECQFHVWIGTKSCVSYFSVARGWQDRDLNPICLPMFAKCFPTEAKQWITLLG